MLGWHREIAERWQLSADALRPALATGECPLCRMLVQATDDLTGLLLRAEELPGSMCDETREARGFCGIHAWRLLEAGAARGLPAMGVVRPVRDVLAHALSALALYGERSDEDRLDPAVFKRTTRHGWTRRVARRLEPGRKCPVCLAVKLIDETLGYQLLALLGQEDIRAGYHADSALCLPHFRWALQAAGDKATLDCLVEAERERLRSLLSDRSGEGRVAALAHVAGVRWAVTVR